MQICKSLLAGVMVMLVGIGAANAANVSAAMPVTGAVIGEKSVATSALALGNFTKIEANAGKTWNHTVNVNVTAGMPYNLCPDTPGAAAWSYDGNTAVNISNNGGEVKLRVYRDDGTTPLTPTSCWARVGTGADETITLVFMTSISNGTGIGDLSKTLQMTLSD
jgi:hypothetical protein